MIARGLARCSAIRNLPASPLAKSPSSPAQLVHRSRSPSSTSTSNPRRSYRQLASRGDTSCASSSLSHAYARSSSWTSTSRCATSGRNFSSQPLTWRPRQESCQHHRYHHGRSRTGGRSQSASSSYSTTSGRRVSFSTSTRPTAKPAATKPTTAKMMASVAGTSAAAGALLLAPFVEKLDRIAPRFQIHGSQVQILETPVEFYEKLKSMIRQAEHRIFLSTLYIGKSEKELITTLQEALRAKPGLKLYILTDALRGTREAPNPSCASLLAPLVEEFGADRVEVRMYHTPNLTGLRKKYVPKRINEGWGLQHMKLYGADDEILLSGANLSTDYFTNRQDRYHLFSSRDLTNFYWQLHQSVSSLSFLVQPAPNDPAGFNLAWPATNPAPSPLEDPGTFVDKATGVLRSLMEPLQSLATTSKAITNGDASSATPTPDTSVYVLAQMTQLLKPDYSTERPALAHILETLAQPQYASASWTFTAGYFNPAPALTKLLLATAAQKNNTVITASPYANGFYQSSGISGMLPDAYTFLAHRFLKSVVRQGHASSITLKEWRNGTVSQPGGWTYHAKGLWVTLPDQGPTAGPRGPSIALVGSSNYTKRSYSLDLEANALVVTQNAALQARLAEEERWLQKHATAVTRDDFAQPERRVRLHVRVAMWIVQAVGGAL